LGAENNHVATQKGLWFWAEEAQLNPNELWENLLLAKDKYGYIVLHHAASFDRLGLL
jgi:hypothetical protein